MPEPQQLARLFRDAAPAVDFCSLRYVRERSELWNLRDEVVEAPQLHDDEGVMITVVHGGGLGYAATSDLSLSGLRWAADRARAWAERTAGRAVMDFGAAAWTMPQGRYAVAIERPWSSASVDDKIGLLRVELEAMKGDARVVERTGSLLHISGSQLLLDADGGCVEQELSLLSPDLCCVTHDKGLTQKRSFGARGRSQQGGLEVLERIGLGGAGVQLREEALALLSAEDCPSGAMDLVLAPDQMMLQIHESIGHPLELDRILGDERNYAGTSFVTLDMFGSYAYGSELLDVTFDPSVAGQFASYGYDDEGSEAERQYVIRGGLLLRPLGGALSQQRAGLPGVANSRASSWNRPPIDRMANLNVEPGSSSFDQLLGQVEHGVYMQTNTSWSIDDSRNKFQFGCELGRVIEEGELKQIVRNPNYRGISATFWRSLAGVGDRATLEVLGTPYCGKGEPNQVIRVGHAAPTCRFANVDVFGGHR